MDFTVPKLNKIMFSSLRNRWPQPILAIIFSPFGGFFRTSWKLFLKRNLCTKFDIYVFYISGNTIHTDVSPFGDSPYINVTYIVHNQPQVKPHDDNNNDMAIPDEQRLMTYILNGYEKSVRPVRNASTAVKIKMGMTLGQIFDMVGK